MTGLFERTWSYQTDAVGNILRVDEQLDCTAADLTLTDQTVSGSEVFEACGKVTAGPGFEISPSGDVTLRAGGAVALAGGFSVASGATLSIEPDFDLGLPASSIRSYGIQDHQYYLRDGDGPWGLLEWSYDRVGNRLTETRDGTTDSYSYAANAAGSGNTAVLQQIQLGAGGTRDYTSGSAGHLELIAEGADQVDLGNNDEGRLSDLSRLAATTTFQYDGRGFLRGAEEAAAGTFTVPTYSSEGLLHSLNKTMDGGASTFSRHVFYFAGRPVATLEEPSIYTFLSTDHLGTPILATALDGRELWSGGFEPFGEDWQSGTSLGARENDVFLRFPGQWDDETWQGYSLGAEVYYNVYRWYQGGLGRYNRPDPAGIAGGINPLLYSASRPLSLIDPTGLAYFAKRPLKVLLGVWLGFFSCNPGSLADIENRELSHEQLIFEDGKIPQNIGFDKEGGGMLKSDPVGTAYRCRSKRYDDCTIRIAVANVPVRRYCLAGSSGVQNNCQDWADAVRAEYERLVRNPEIQRTCCIRP